MHRTEGTNFTESGGKKYFTDGPPGTQLEQFWHNAVQEEISAVIEAAGLTLNTQSLDASLGSGAVQLLSALQGGGTGLDITAKALNATGATNLAALTASGLITGSNRIICNDTTDASNPTDGSLQTDGGLSVAKKGYFGDNIVMADGKGIDFSAYTDGSVAGTTTAQILKDYEEGTWDPAIDAVTGGTITGNYTKIGRALFFSVYFQATGGTINSATMTGLPYTSAADLGFGSGVGGYSGLSGTSAGWGVNWLVDTSSANIRFSIEDEATGSSIITTAQLTNSFVLNFCGMYNVA